MTAIRQCAVLAGGQETDPPRAMLPVAGRPFLSWLLQELCRFGMTDVLLLTGHHAREVEAALPGLVAGLPRPMTLTICPAPPGAGTGGALLAARDFLHERFLLLDGGSCLDYPLGPMLTAAPEAGVLVQMLHPGGGVAQYRGVCVFDRRALDHIGPRSSLEREVLPALAASGQLRSAQADGWFIDMGRAQEELPRHLSRPALFLDRDGVCNIDHGWVGTRDRFEWMPGAKAAIADATARGWHVFLVTNQSGVARGHYTERDVVALHDWMLGEVLAAGGTIDDVRYCPYHVDAVIPAYRQASAWRKPAPGMILDLLRAWRLDPARCLMVGDQPTDMQAAAAAGVQGHLFAGGDLAAFLRPRLDAAAAHRHPSIR